MDKKIQKIIEKVRPYIQMHGGNVELLDIKDDTVKLKVSGACVGCRLADQTFNHLLGGMIREAVPKIKKIIINPSPNPSPLQGEGQGVR